MDGLLFVWEYFAIVRFEESGPWWVGQDSLMTEVTVWFGKGICIRKD